MQGPGAGRLADAELVELFVGIGAARVRDLFRQARASALLDRETLSGEDLEQLVEAHQGAQAAA